MAKRGSKPSASTAAAARNGTHRGSHKGRRRRRKGIGTRQQGQEAQEWNLHLVVLFVVVLYND